MFEEYIVGGISIMAVIMGLVQLVKKLGVSGNILILVSVLIGFVIGAVYKLTGMYPQIAPWLELVIFALYMGLGATGLYSVGDRFVEKLSASKDNNASDTPAG